jgi:moderate conductance mechanosensitive channel
MFSIYIEKLILNFGKIIIKGIKIFLIFVFAFFLNRFISKIFKKYLEDKIKDGLNGEKRKRIHTLTLTIGGTFRLIIWLLAFLTFLSELGINIGPILASLGLIGFAVSMAAKDILSDFISGIFILLEDQYHVGDKIRVGNLEGEVVEFNLRRTIIKDENGVFHLIPNSQIKIVSKRS